MNTTQATALQICTSTVIQKKSSLSRITLHTVSIEEMLQPSLNFSMFFCTRDVISASDQTRTPKKTHANIPTPMCSCMSKRKCSEIPPGNFHRHSLPNYDKHTCHQTSIVPQIAARNMSSSFLFLYFTKEMSK